MLAQVTEIVDATDLPVRADLEHGYGTTPEAAAETYRLAAATGLAGASIEDATGDLDAPILDLRRAAERVSAAAKAVHALPLLFTLTASAENYLWGRHDLPDTVARLQAYQESGADVLYAPGLSSEQELAAVVSSVDRPVNVTEGLRGVAFSLKELSCLGVKRVSVGSALIRAAFDAFLRATHEMREQGCSGFASGAGSYQEISAMFE